jgi:hypothetical protein
MNDDIGSKEAAVVCTTPEIARQRRTLAKVLIGLALVGGLVGGVALERAKLVG